MKRYLLISLLLNFLPFRVYALSISNSLYTKRGLTVIGPTGPDAKSSDGYGTFFSDDQLDDIRVYWIEDRSVKRVWEIPEESKVEIKKEQEEMNKRAARYKVQYRAELHPMFQYIDDYIYKPESAHKRPIDYDPAHAQISVSVEFVPPQNQESNNAIRQAIEAAKGKLSHERNDKVAKALKRLFKAIKIDQIIAAGLGTTQTFDGIGREPIPPKVKYPEEVFDFDEIPWIQNAFILEIGKKFVCPVILQDPAYSDAEKSVLSSYSMVRVLDDPDAIRAINDKTLMVSWSSEDALHEMAWWSEHEPDRPVRPAAILSDVFDEEDIEPLMQQMRGYYEEVAFLSSCADTDPFPSSSLWVRKDLAKGLEGHWDDLEDDFADSEGSDV